MVPFWVLSTIHHLVFWGHKSGTVVLTTTHMVWILEAMFLHNEVDGPSFYTETKEAIKPYRDFMSAMTVSWPSQLECRLWLGMQRSRHAPCCTLANSASPSMSATTQRPNIAAQAAQAFEWPPAKRHERMKLSPARASQRALAAPRQSGTARPTNSPEIGGHTR